MGFEDNRDDYWRGRDEGSHSKRNLLKVAVECGAIPTGFEDGCEVPYYGVTFHAEMLQAEGLLKHAPDQPIEGCTIWIPTEAGKKEVTSWAR